MADENYPQLDNTIDRKTAEEYLRKHLHLLVSDADLSISPNMDDLITKKNCKKFATCLTILDVKKIHLDAHNNTAYLANISAENWKLIGNYLLHTGIQAVSLVKISLDKFTIDSLNIFLNICFNSHQVKYCSISLAAFSAEPEKWTAFCHAITTSKSTEIFFDACQLSQLNSEQHHQFLEALKLSRILKLEILNDPVSRNFKNDLNEILQEKQKQSDAAKYLREQKHRFIGIKNTALLPKLENLMTEEKCQLFTSSLKALDIKEIFLDPNEDHDYLSKITAEHWKLLGKHLSGSAIQKIELIQFSLNSFKENMLQAFLENCFKLSKVKFCMIHISDLAADSERWSIFCNAIAFSNSHDICFDGTELHKLNTQQQQDFLEALKASNITHLEISQDPISQAFQDEIFKILRKNQVTRDLKDTNGLFKIVARQLLWENYQSPQSTEPKTKIEIDPHNKISDEIYENAVAKTKEDKPTLTMS